MTENERRVNPFERPKPKAVISSHNANTLNKRMQMQKMDNFRDELNKQLFGENQDGQEEILPNEAAKKQYKVPPKVVRTPEGLSNGEIISSSEVNQSQKAENVFVSGSNIKAEDLKSNNNPNTSFSEENCSSVLLSDNKNIKHNLLESASYEKREIEPLENRNTVNAYQINRDGRSGKEIPSEEFVSPHRNQTSSPKSFKENKHSINNSVPNEEETSQSKLIHTTLSSNELSAKLDKLKHEIIQLKQSKYSIDSNYHLEVNKNKLYENELDLVRKTLNDYKLKQIKEGETMLKLEIENLKNSLQFKNKENDLLQKQNQNLSGEVKKLQNYIKEILNSRHENIELHSQGEYLEKDEDIKEALNYEKEILLEDHPEKIDIENKYFEDLNQSQNNDPEQIESEDNYNNQQVYEADQNYELNNYDYTEVLENQYEETKLESPNVKGQEDNIVQVLKSSEHCENQLKEKLIQIKEPELKSPKQEGSSISQKTREKNLFENITTDVNEVFSVSDTSKHINSNQSNQRNTNLAPTPSQTRAQRTVLNKKNEVAENSFKKTPLNEKQDKKLNVFAFDLHNNDDDLGTIFGSLTKNQNKSEGGSNLFD